MNKDIIKKYAGAIIAFVIAATLTLFIFFALFRIDAIANSFKHISNTLLPFIIGGILAYILKPICNKLDKILIKPFSFIKNEKKRQSVVQGTSVGISILMALIFVYIIIIIVVPNLINSIVRLAQVLPGSVEKLIDTIRKTLSSNQTLMMYSEEIINRTYRVLDDWINNDLMKFLQNYLTAISSGVVSVFVILFQTLIGFIVATYILLSRKKLGRQGEMIIYSLFKKENADAIMEEIVYTDKVFGGFINGKIIDAIVIAIICYIGLSLFSLLNPDKEMMSEVLIAVIVGIFNVIPFFGWYVAWFIGALLCLIINPMQCIFFIVFNFILQQIDGNIIGPKILGDTTGISSFWVLFAILLFGDLWGFAGMLIGVPTFAVIYHLIKKSVYRGLRKNYHEDMIKEYERDYPPKDMIERNQNK